MTLFGALVSVLSIVPAHSAQGVTSQPVYCVSVQVRPLEVAPTSELFHHLAVTLFNSCPKDITAFTLDVRSGAGDTSHSYRVGVDRLPQLVVQKYWDSPDQHKPDIDWLRVNSFVELTTPQPQPAQDPFEGSVQVVAVTFIDGSGLGDPRALSAILAARKATLKNHKDQVQALGLLTDRDRAVKMLRQPLKETDKATRDGLAALRQEGFSTNALDNSDQAAWARHVADKAFALRTMAELYEQHITKTEQVQE